MSSMTFRLFIGALLSIADFVWSHRNYKKTRGADRNRECLQAIEYLLDHQSSSEDKNTPHYQQAIARVREHLQAVGLIRADLNYYLRFRHLFDRFSTQEKINNLSWLALIVIAAVLELTYDFLLGWYFSPDQGWFSMLFADVYQIPVLFVGLLMGRGMKSVIHWLVTKHEQTRLEQTIAELIEKTEIVEIVVNYHNEVAAHAGGTVDMQPFKVTFTHAGKRIAKRLQDISHSVVEKTKTMADDIIHYEQRQQESYEKESQQRQTRFDDITKGR